MSSIKINIAIDGFSSCGKSTLAKQLAKRMSYIHIDSGAMYRAVTLFFIENKIALENQIAIRKALDAITIKIVNNEGDNFIFLNDRDVNQEIRSNQVNDLVSEVATIFEVRKRMACQQSIMSLSKGVVMDGRDIGTVVMPNAEVKLYLTAEVDVRIRRRFLEMKQSGYEISFEKVKQNLLSRDHIDSTRKNSPLTKANDAIELDTSFLSKEEQLEKVLKIIDDLQPGFIQ